MISIIIATYNAELYLDKTLESLRLQTYKLFELIIVDGLSTDRTIDIVEAYHDIVSISIIEKDDGLYDAWNKGIAVATGEWICFLGAGDTLMNDTIEKYENLITSIDHEIDFISGKLNRIDVDGKLLTISGNSWKWNEFKRNMSVAHVGSLHAKSLFLEYGLYDTNYKICADYELLLRKGSKLNCLFLDSVIGNMPIGGVSFSTRALVESLRIKRNTAKQPMFNVLYQFVIQYILLKTFRLRHIFKNK